MYNMYATESVTVHIQSTFNITIGTREPDTSMFKLKGIFVSFFLMSFYSERYEYETMLVLLSYTGHPVVTTGTLVFHHTPAQ